MSSFIIEGGRKLQGEVHISGSKNASLPIIAASILNGGVTKLYNVPIIHDTETMFEILKLIGCKIKKGDKKIIIDSSKINKFEIPDNLMREMRSSVVIAGSLLGKYRKATFSYPGGCDIGTRPIDLHLKGFEKLGINIAENYGNITCFCDRIIGGKIDLDFPSVGATENIILAACLANGITIINNAAREPEIVDLQNFLNKMGAKIRGAGSNIIEIIGVKQLKDVSYNVMPDRIETGTYLCAAAITGGNIKLLGANEQHILPVINKLEEANCKIEIAKNSIEIIGPKKIKAVNIKTMPYPGFPTDMQSIFATVMTVAKGTSIIVENIFESRYKYTQELIRMGAKITIEGNTAIIKGTKRLHGANIKATDLRGGASLIIASLNAKGKTRLDDIHYILRGYENIDKKLQKLGANIIVE